MCLTYICNILNQDRNFSVIIKCPNYSCVFLFQIPVKMARHHSLLMTCTTQDLCLNHQKDSGLEVSFQLHVILPLFFCLTVLPKTCHLSRLPGLPSMSHGGGACYNTAFFFFFFFCSAFLFFLCFFIQHIYTG